ncbi:hypothetical protein [Streptosporangium vulgare]|uniref:hypothetical protein n=1 Tax=Streptosporangium vulgare TaxID=46190 RepID=UPI0031DA3443
MLTTLLVTLSLLLQVGFQPVAQAATSITLDFPMPEGFDRADLTAWAADFNNRNDLLSETIQEEIASHPADFPGAEDLEPREFDGAFTVTGGGLSVTIEADVNINDLTWWEEVLMWVSVTAGGVVFRVACVLTLVPVMANPNFAKGICAGLAVIISKGLVLLITALKHGPSDDWHFWERALVGLVLEALTAAIWGRLVRPVDHEELVELGLREDRRRVRVGRQHDLALVGVIRRLFPGIEHRRAWTRPRNHPKHHRAGHGAGLDASNDRPARAAAG